MNEGGSEIQVERGQWTRIHNKILELLAIGNFTVREYRCLLFLFRTTYGDKGKKAKTISLGEWAQMTGLKRQNVWTTLTGLEEKRVIFSIDHGPKKAKTWGFQKYYSKWASGILPEGMALEDEDIINHEPAMPDNDSHAQSVIASNDRYAQTVIPRDDSEQSVIASDYRSDPICNPTRLQSVIPSNDRLNSYKDKITTTKKEEGGGSSDIRPTRSRQMDSEYATVCSKYENNIGLLTESIGEQLKEALNENPMRWILEAIDIATGAEKRNLRYVMGILRRWHQEGKNTDHAPTASVNGQVNLNMGEI